MIYILGGIGLFLLGMGMLTDSLKELAGELLKKWLNKFTGGSFRSVFSGMGITALLQSSTATTIIIIGFVSAGLLSFTQSIGLIIGANIGSTSTGWIVSLIGFKLDMNALSLPIIGVGIFLKTFASKKYKAIGAFIAGFGLLFLGINFIQEGTSTLENMFVFDSFTTDSFYDKILLIIIGIVMTIIMQSSSAAVATTLTILFTGAISFDQAAFLVIGQNIGTTATAVLAAIGASVPAKRTALTHVLFNVFTAVIIFSIYPILLSITTLLTTWINGEFDAMLGIAIFHTLFSVVGAIVFMPFVQPFAKLLKRIVVDKGNPLTSYLDANVAVIPSVAIAAAFKTMLEIMKELTAAIVFFIQSKDEFEFENKLKKIEDAVTITRRFLNTVQSSSKIDHENHLSLLHVLDHSSRLMKVLREENKVEATILQESLMKKWYDVLTQIQSNMVNGENLVASASLLEKTSAEVANERKTRRHTYFQRTVNNEAELDVTVSKVEALLWIDRLVFHYWRAVTHMAEYAKD